MIDDERVPMSATEITERNKANAKAFYALMFNDCEPAKAIELYAGDSYTQHNPTVADGKQGVSCGRSREIEAMLGNTDDQATNDVDHQNEQACNGIAADELAGTIHRAKKVGLLANLLAAALRLALVD